jgi:hypothetical protein
MFIQSLTSLSVHHWMQESMSLLTPPRMPVQLYPAIFRYTTTSDLAVLSRVSHTFQREAEHILYHYVNLQDIIDGERLASWCLMIIGTPRRAHRVHYLRFPRNFKLPQLPSEHASSPDQSWLAKLLHCRPTTSTLELLPHPKPIQVIALAFKALVNLKELFVVGPRLERDGLSELSIHPSTFEDCEFRLSHFGGELPGFTVEEMWNLFFNHPGISYWVPGDVFAQSVSSFPRGMLPHLQEVVLVRPDLIKFLIGRPIRSLVLVFQQAIHNKDTWLGTIQHLGFFKDTLRTLVYINFNLGVDWTSVDIIRSIAQEVPKLRSLTLCSGGSVSFEDLYIARTITDHNVICQVNKNDQQNLVDAVARFQQLDTLVVNFDMMVLYDSDIESPDPYNPLEHTAFWSRHSPAQCRKVATMFLAACPSLRRFSFPLKTLSNETSDLSYVRPDSQDNEAKLDGFYVIDTYSWWMK